MQVLRNQELQTTDILVGDRIKVGKYTATCQAVTNGMAVFLLDQYLDKAYSMNSKRTNDGGYEKSELRAEIKNAECDTNFDAIREQLVPFDNGDLLRIPTVGEMFGNGQLFDDYYEMDDAEQWPLMKDRRNRVADRESEIYEWGWLQNRPALSAANFALVHCRGHPAFRARFWLSWGSSCLPVGLLNHRPLWAV